LLIKVNGAAEWLDLEKLEYTDAVDADETGPGAITAFRGTPGFVCFPQKGGRLILVNSRHVVGLRATDAGAVLETARDREVEVFYNPELAVGLLNKARLHVS